MGIRGSSKLPFLSRDSLRCLTAQIQTYDAFENIGQPFDAIASMKVQATICSNAQIGWTGGMETMFGIGIVRSMPCSLWSPA